MTSHTRRTILGAAGAGALATVLPAPSWASNTGSRSIKGVVELFTSQGCSSCPPADKFLHTLAERDDVLALAFHVDYWDYLGWEDTLATPANTRRQYAYRETLGNRSPYTPQAVVNGVRHFVGSRGSEVEAGLMQGKQELYVPVTATKNDMHLRIEVGEVAPLSAPAVMTIAYFRSHTEVAVERGENRGRTLSYVNAVTAMDTISTWSGEAVTKEMPLAELNKHDADNCAVLIQKTDLNGAPGAILGAAVLNKGPMG